MGYNRTKDIARDFLDFDPDTYEPDSKNHKIQNNDNNTFDKRKRVYKTVNKVLPLPPSTLIKSENKINNFIDSNFDLVQQQQQMQSTSNTHDPAFFEPVLPLRVNSRRDNTRPQTRTYTILTSSACPGSQCDSEKKGEQKTREKLEKHDLSPQDQKEKHLISTSHRKDSIPEYCFVQTTPLPIPADSMSSMKASDCMDMTNTPTSISAIPPTRDSQHQLPSNLMASTTSKHISSSQNVNTDQSSKSTLQKSKATSKLPSPLFSSQQMPIFSFFAANVHNSGIEQFISSLSLPLPPAPAVKSAEESPEKRFSDITDSNQYEHPDLSQLAEEALLDLQNHENLLEKNPQPHNWRYSNAVQNFITEDLSALDFPFAPDLSFSPAFAKPSRPLSLSSNNSKLSDLRLTPPQTIVSINNNRKSGSSLLFNTLSSSISNLSLATAKQYKKRRSSRLDGFKKENEEEDDDAITFGHRGHCYDPPTRDTYNSKLSSIRRKKKLSALSAKLKTAVVSIFR
jgi:hypothetical protein